MEAAADGQTARIEYLLRLGVNLDYRDKHGFTALHHAALSGIEDTVRSLVDAGANINATGPSCGTPICLAALKARLDICSLLLSRRSRITGLSTGGGANILECALHCAVIGNDGQCIRLFMDARCDINQWCTLSGVKEDPVLAHLCDGMLKLLFLRGNYMQLYQLLHLAIINRNATAVELLIAAGALLNDPGVQSPGRRQTLLAPLMVSAACDDVQSMKDLISHGADPGFKDALTGVTALMCAAAHGKVDCVKLLIGTGVDINHRAGMHGTALEAAISGLHQDVAVLLLQNGASYGVSHLGLTALDLAGRNGLENVAHALARRCASFHREPLTNSYTLISLLNVQNFEYRTFGVFAEKFRPPAYATLSHRWGPDEVLFDKFNLTFWL